MVLRSWSPAVARMEEGMGLMGSVRHACYARIWTIKHIRK
ncbi:protein of unknown function [Thiomonas sp. Bio17B3]|nr:hypothetical protein THICB3270017 [Thiomonas sp. CB3]VDY06887.1 protein of unknown function [Thiomonas sp. Bio17B3]VDY15162.1 conserved protein of unknown function [Thiomonas sp. OC7]VDY15665.1 protein of unknown function [Thiomonas sp. CB2]